MDAGELGHGRPGAGHPGGAQPAALHPAGRRGALAPHAAVGHEHRSRVRPKRTQIVALSTAPPEGATVVCVDELGPVTPRTFPPAPGWSPDGHRIKAPLEYSRGRDKAWVFGALRVQDGHVLTQTAASRNTAGYLELLRGIARANPTGDVYLIADNLSSHTSGPIRAWLAEHPRLHHAFIPVGAAWLNLIEGWGRWPRGAAFAGQGFANREEIPLPVGVATRQLNARARPWIWGRPPKAPRQLRRRFVYCL